MMYLITYSTECKGIPPEEILEELGPEATEEIQDSLFVDAEGNTRPRFEGMEWGTSKEETFKSKEDAEKRYKEILKEINYLKTVSLFECTLVEQKKFQ
jgi:hypothetical protein